MGKGACGYMGETSASIFLCTCGGILEEFLDFGSLVNDLKKCQNVSEVLVHSSLCQQQGLSLIESGRKGSSGVVLGTCSKRIYDLISGKPGRAILEKVSPVEIVNIREQCAWVHTDRNEATAKAKLMLLTATRKVGALQPIVSKTLKVEERALVIGGGVAGIQATADLANLGFETYLVETLPTIGGKMALLGCRHLCATYPTDACAICIRGPKMADVSAHPNVRLLTHSDVTGVERFPEKFKVKITTKPRFVDSSKCTQCGTCSEKCPVKVPNEWNGGLGYRKAIYLPYPQAIPRAYTIDTTHCLFFQKGDCNECERVCEAKAIKLDDEPKETQLDVGAIIVATGFEEFNPSQQLKLGYGKLEDVITQFQLTRILDSSGPTEGKLKKPSDSTTPKRITMIQCVGSRDPQTNLYCSRYCCMAAMKNAILINEQDPEAQITVIYKDIRVTGKGFEEYYSKAKERSGIQFAKGEAVEVTEDAPGQLKVQYLSPSGEKHTIPSDLVVLSSAMVPPHSLKELAGILNLKLSDDGFVKELDEKVSTTETNRPGIYICGVTQGPKDIPESVAQASAAAAKAARRMRMVLQKPVLAPSALTERCGKCGLCAAVCPYQAINVSQDGISIDETLCTGCGLCVTTCGTRALAARTVGTGQLSSEISDILKEAPDILKPIVLTLACEECGYTVLDNAGFLRQHYPAQIIPVVVPCASSISLNHIVEALNCGAGGIIVLGCGHGRCHYEKGSEVAKARMSVMKHILKEGGISDESVTVLSLPGSASHTFSKVANATAQRVRRSSNVE